LNLTTRVDQTVEVIAMLAEKFFLILETLRSRSSDDKPPVVISTAPHIAIKLPRRKQVNAEAAN
jgi:hypothetical protein